MTLFRKLRTHLSFANVTSLMALFIALSGVAWAASLPRNSVGVVQIKTNGVSRAEIKKNAVSNDELKDGAVNATEIGDGTVGATELGLNSVNGSKIGDGTVALADLAPNSIDGSKVVDGSLGGAEVTDGSLGTGDVAAGTFLGGKVTAQYEVAAAALGETATGQGTSYDVHCPEGQVAIGGGGRGDATDSEFTVIHSSRPITSTTSSGPPVDNGTFTGWRITVTNPVGDLPQDAGSPGPADGAILPEVWVLCAGAP